MPPDDFGVETIDYSPDLKGVYQDAGWWMCSGVAKPKKDQPLDPSGKATWQTLLISAEINTSAVTSAGKTNRISVDIIDQGTFLRVSPVTTDANINVSLLDVLGRPIRSWQFPISSGEREITLNVADVPTGVYFLRVSGEGIDEVKKVCIAH